MSFQDVFKSSFLESVSSFSVGEVLVAMLLSVVVGLFIFWIYKKTFTGVMYSSGMALTLIGLTMVTTLVIIAVTSNVVLSLGMVGALSIVRFRTAIKEPMEIVFLFWAIVAGIVIGAGLLPLAIIGSAIIGLILFLFANRKRVENAYILVLNCETEEAEAKAADVVKGVTGKYRIKSKTVNAQGIEITTEMKLKDEKMAFINRLNEIPGVTNATLVSYNGVYMS